MCRRSVGQESPAEERCCWGWVVVGGWVKRPVRRFQAVTHTQKWQWLLPCLPRATSSGKPRQLRESSGEPFSFRCCWGSLLLT